MAMDSVISIMATITLFEMMVTIGLSVTLADVANVARNWRTVARAALANYVCVPVAAVGLLLLFRAHPMVAAGFLIAAVCPGAPYAPPCTAMAKGNVVLSVGLMVILAGSSAVIAPLLLQALLPLMAGNEHLKINVGKMVGTLVLSQFLPLCIGLVLRHRRPALAEKLLTPFTGLSKALNLGLVAVVLAVQFQMLTEIRLLGYLGMSALLAATFSAGWLAGGPASADRKSMAITTSIRNVGVSLVIASSSFPDTPAIAATTAYALFQTVVMVLVALMWGRLGARHVTSA
jgi:BASS family bile acid:Na+ symporter